MQMAEELRGDGDMCQALLEIMEPEIRFFQEEGWKESWIESWIEGYREGRKEGILGAVKVLRNLGQSSSEIKPILMETYGLFEQEADDYLSI